MTFIDNNLNLFLVGVTVAATVILGFIVYFNDVKSSTNKAFLFFALMSAGWGAFNYLNYNVSDTLIAFWSLRISIFIAVWHAFSLFHLLTVFPSGEAKYSKLFKYVLVPIVTICSISTLTPFVFRSIEKVSDGKIVEISNGNGIIFFTITVFTLIVSGIYRLFKKILNEKSGEKQKLIFVFLGLVLTFILILTFNFIYPAFLKNSSYTPFGALFILPFLAFTSYAIFRLKFFHVKVVSTQILVFLLAVITLSEVILSQTPLELMFRVSEFFLVLFFGVLLVNSVTKEVKQREELQTLTQALEQTNTKLQNLDQARSDFITIASHQLRTPPTTIKWYLSAIRGGDYGQVAEPLKVALSKAEAVNNSLISLIDDLLNASRIERGKMEFVFEPTDLANIVKSITEQLQPLASIKNLRLELNLPTNLPPMVLADKEKVRQVVNNFVDNAIKYSNKGIITVNLSETADSVQLEVKDQGKGFAPETGKTLFHKYTRGQDSAVHSTGLGLGLYVAKVVVDKHNGKIWASSEGEGKGAVFGFSLLINNNLPEHDSLNLAPAETIEE